MKKLTIVLTQILACGLWAAPASAQFSPQATAVPGSVPEGISYQGRLEDGGFPVNATKSMVFRVYSAVSGGTLLWTSPAQNVSVALGLFNASVPVPITTLVGGGARYLEVQIDGTLMSPRELLNSVPYALIAKSVEGTIDVSTAGLAINANSAATEPAFYISSQTGNVGVGTGSPSTAFDVGGSAQFGSGSTKSTFSATGALNTAGTITAPDYTATYGISASTGVFAYVLASSITTTGNINVQGSVALAGGARLTTVAGSATEIQIGVMSGHTASIVPDIIVGDASAIKFHSGANTNFGLVQTANALLFKRNEDEAGAVEAMRINATGQVGIGGVAPNNPLTVQGNVDIAAGGLGIGAPSPATALDVNGNAQFGSGAAKSTFSTTGALTLATNAAFTGSSSVTASGFFGRTAMMVGPETDTTEELLRLTKLTFGGTIFKQYYDPSTAYGLQIGGTEGRTAIVTDTGANPARVGIGGVLLPRASLDVNGNAQFGSGAAKSTFTAAGALAMGGSLTFSPDNTLTIGGGPATTRPSAVYAGFMMTGDGLVAAPSYRFNGGNAGIYRPNGLAVTNGASAGAHFTMTSGLSVGSIAAAIGAETATLQVISTSTTAGHNVLRLDNNAGAALVVAQQNGRVGVGSSAPNDLLDVAGGNVRLTAAAGVAGSVKLFSLLTVGVVDCASQCGANGACLAAWDGAGTISTCATAAAANRCLCSGFGD